jgi:hypothetical protein
LEPGLDLQHPLLKFLALKLLKNVAYVAIQEALAESPFMLGRPEKRTEI